MDDRESGDEPTEWPQFLGGCQPTATQDRLARTRMGRLSRKAATVARPAGVSPVMTPPRSDQRKCSCQSRCRGLKSRTTSPAVGSWAAIRLALASLRGEQASQRASSAGTPPSASGFAPARKFRILLRCQCHPGPPDIAGEGLFKDNQQGGASVSLTGSSICVHLRPLRTVRSWFFLSPVSRLERDGSLMDERSKECKYHRP